MEESEAPDERQRLDDDRTRLLNLSTSLRDVQRRADEAHAAAEAAYQRYMDEFGQ